VTHSKHTLGAYSYHSDDQPSRAWKKSRLYHAQFPLMCEWAVLIILRHRIERRV